MENKVLITEKYFIFYKKEKNLQLKQMFNIITLNKKIKLGDDNIDQFTSRRI